KLCGGVNNYICAVFERADEVGRGEGGIYYKGYSVLVRDGADCLHIDEVRIGVAHTFGINQLSVGLYGPAEIFAVGLVHERGCYALFGQSYRQKVVRAAV